MELVEGNVVLCTVKKIEKTNVFVDIEGDGEGSIVLSEVAAGRIRNLREYVTPNKRIVCKILHIEKGHIQLSLRRVTAKERDEVLEGYKKEKRIISMLKAVVKNHEGIIKKIKEEYDLDEFFEKARESLDTLKKFFSEEEVVKIAGMLKEKIQKDKLVKKIFKIASNSSKGLLDLKDILNIKDVEIKYLGSSRFSISVKAGDFKEANKKLTIAIDGIKHKAKEKGIIFEVSEK